MTIFFSKYQGTGNDFIIIDNRENKINLSYQQINFLCNRKFGIGADGLMLLNSHSLYDFEMIYYNADGHESSMCGNGGRCITQFAHDIGLIKDKYLFTAIDGLHEAVVKDIVYLKIQDVKGVENEHNEVFILNTGSPHYIKILPSITDLDVYTEGKKIRYNSRFEKEGINVNFVQRINDNTIKVRTYERGVEDETLSCGTGVTAAALVNATTVGFNEVNIQTIGGNLLVQFSKESDQVFHNIWLCGPANFVFSGSISI
ncbi:MAG TPA: diaminopimelate epimerase [Chitinophagaceae bacterium]|nr:diaminopimelate epimerase [Chitinophagaceae bacterium]MCC6636035.1 diaminopimelate epimerase [Chitinophagaceae bacterium]HMZ46286.1 diaminopimelate epimerase [Chitinophagaceae bacterium]HNF29133.1 diaminopimelate epimerase [Chitinophagaceae bacterium]HNJ57689.1 diaminopimelate epimerase [Chitinophagaceae bacterium]